MVINNSVALTRNIIITSPKPITKEDFVIRIEKVATGILNFLKKNGCKELGHIKFISTTDGEDYLQISILDMGQKPVVKGMLKKAFDKVKLTLNIIEFGVHKEDINSKINKEIENIQKYFDGL